MQEDSSSLKNKFRGCLLGVAIEDGLGAPFEGAPTVSVPQLPALLERPGSLRYTDDTHMTIGLAQSLVDRGSFDGRCTAEVFARNFSREPWRGYGPGPPQVFRLIEQGVPWDQAGRLQFGGKGSFGNGAAMRVAPVALFAFEDLDRVAQLARESAIITHSHPLGVDGAVVQAVGIAMLLRMRGGAPVDHEAFVQELKSRSATPEFQRILAEIKDVPDQATPPEVAARLGNGIEAVRSVPSAVYAFLRHPDSFSDAVLFAIGLGGDTDTIASMTGALSGAYLGETGVPANWRTAVEDADYLRKLAEQLYDALGV